MRHIALAALLMLIAPTIARAQGYQMVPTCGQATPPPGTSAGYMDSTGRVCGSGTIAGSVNTIPSATTYQGTMTLAAATSTALTSGNVTMSNSTVLPAAGSFTRLFILNTGANTVFVCWFGGTCSATSGGETLVAGASDTKNLTGGANAPTFYSTSGTTLSFGN